MDSRTKKPLQITRQQTTWQARCQPSCQPGALQPKSPAPTQTKRAPLAPPVFRPQPLPKVLQQKLHSTRPGIVHPEMNKRHPAPPPLHHPQPIQKILQPKMNNSQAHAARIVVQPKRALATPPVLRRPVIQPFKSSVVQATKYYPNLHPGAAIPVERSNIFMLNNFADQYRLQRVNSHGVNVPNQKYNFVRTREGATLLHNRYRHPSLAEGQQVLYAGEVFFNNGRLEWWSNGSGHYQPDEDGAEQANLPMDYFYSYQQIIKGEHTRKNGSGHTR